MKVIVAYSGGKDSQASLIWAVKKYGAKNIKAVFCDTGWENPVTYAHIEETAAELGVELVTVKSKIYDGFVDMSVKKQRFPSPKARFCTVELKTKPMIDYVLDDVADNCFIIQGIRADESAARSLMKKQCTFFKYYFEPLNTDPKTGELKLDKNGEPQKPKFHTYRKKDVNNFVSKYVDDIFRPVFDWTGQNVVDYILENGQRPNLLYYEGSKRVGCYPCIMSNHGEFLNIINRSPERIKEMNEAEATVGKTFFRPDYVPDWAKGQDEKDGKGNPINFVPTVVKYLTDKNATMDMFEDETGPSCMSFYSLCE